VRREIIFCLGCSLLLLGEEDFLLLSIEELDIVFGLSGNRFEQGTTGIRVVTTERRILFEAVI
jgi:hypothetical protein